ncbi:hypothetical protein J7T55_000596 [Diaporthe amygdali]|uniref:uncharacterized protein n=1 Tax=Phomopsis amygdali TaxID=1214568 RepID=UPI0022FEBCDF|nr:uncharacterized protein J7T55_000596 [Diaporthe amygdali]KAJ0110164.1 hypothetical protein J7T55_000596 [Diaporthe amygdali]
MSSTALDAKVYRPPDSSAGTVTSWIPLVTPYSLHGEQCTSAFWRWNPAGTSIVGWDPGYGISVDQNFRCLPEAVTTWWNQNWLGPNTETVVSIGPLTCPEAYSVVATHIEDESRTRVACCPSGYTFKTWQTFGNPGECYSQVDSGVVLTVQTSNDQKEWSPTTVTTNTTTSVIAVHINGWIFAEETGSSEPSPEASTSSCPSDDGSLSTGDAVGIGVGVGLGVIGLATFAAGLFMMRRSKKIQKKAQVAPEVSMHNDPRLQGTSGTPYTYPGSHGGYSAEVEGNYKAPASELPGVNS